VRRTGHSVLFPNDLALSPEVVARSYIIITTPSRLHYDTPPIGRFKALSLPNSGELESFGIGDRGSLPSCGA
ncbi:MAG: hypothetical protein J7464_13460, partial [Chloroflexus sp.]|nr:hypothetical protein [Chloroflexus sp.]